MEPLDNSDIDEDGPASVFGKHAKYNNNRPIPDLAPRAYNPLHAIPVTEEERVKKRNKITRQLYYDYLIEHPIGCILEYPETGKENGK
ncbi:hypothetical protein FRC02_007924, partial [Tulasnella sp. 418]